MILFQRFRKSLWATSLCTAGNNPNLKIITGKLLLGDISTKCGVKIINHHCAIIFLEHQECCQNVCALNLCCGASAVQRGLNNIPSKESLTSAAHQSASIFTHLYPHVLAQQWCNSSGNFVTQLNEAFPPGIIEPLSKYHTYSPISCGDILHRRANGWQVESKSLCKGKSKGILSWILWGIL